MRPHDIEAEQALLDAAHGFRNGFGDLVHLRCP
jgi:hypothetical protein